MFLVWTPSPHAKACVSRNCDTNVHIKCILNTAIAQRGKVPIDFFENRTTKMGATCYFEKKLNKSCVLIWNDEMWLKVIFGHLKWYLENPNYVVIEGGDQERCSHYTPCIIIIENPQTVLLLIEWPGMVFTLHTVMHRESITVLLLREVTRNWIAHCDGVHIAHCDGVHIAHCNGVHIAHCDGVHITHCDGVHITHSDGVHIIHCDT